MNTKNVLSQEVINTLLAGISDEPLKPEEVPFITVLNENGRRVIFENINEMEWFLGPWKTHLWTTAILGIKDYRENSNVCGFVDGHSHLCRAFTYKPDYLPAGYNPYELADLPLEAKQGLVGILHDGSAYQVESLNERMKRQLNRAISAGTRQLWAVTDTTPDIGLIAFKMAMRLKEEYKDRIDLKVGRYPVFGLKDPEKNSDRWDCLKEAKEADFIVGLPEKDDNEESIGFKGHVAMLMDLAFQSKSELHIHVDQTNSAYSYDSFQVIECLEALMPGEKKWFINKGNRPKLWLVHVLSPSSYDAKKFNRLIRLLLKYNIGVIICPRAAVSMREMRSENAPIHNGIARVIEILRAGIPMMFGTDNVNDIFVPSGDGLILTEIDLLADLVRHYAPHIFLKVAMGIQLNKGDQVLLAKALQEREKANERHSQKINTEENGGIKFKY